MTPYCGEGTMTETNEITQVLQRFVDGYIEDVAVIEAALADAATPLPARRPLMGALLYVLDLIDIFPDHYAGLGVVDDAMVLRLSAQHAVEAGAKHEALARLAHEAEKISLVIGDLTGALDRFV
jgi:uncharacterized membrane protein YkvA (DUF1232 family)